MCCIYDRRLGCLWFDFVTIDNIGWSWCEILSMWQTSYRDPLANPCYVLSVCRIHNHKNEVHLRMVRQLSWWTMEKWVCQSCTTTNNDKYKLNWPPLFIEYIRKRKVIIIMMPRIVYCCFMVVVCSMLLLSCVTDAFTVRPSTIGNRVQQLNMVAVDTSDIKNGMTIELDGEPCKVLGFSIMKQARGAAKTTIKFKNLIRGTTIENTYRSGEKFETALIEKMDAQFTFQEGVRSIFIALIDTCC